MSYLWQTLKPYNRFRKQVKRLRQFYTFTMHAYDVTENSTRADLASGALSPNAHILPKDRGGSNHHVKTSLDLLDTYYPRELRRTLLIQLVSLFEAFLVDQLLYVAHQTKRTYRKDLPVQIPRASVLSCRSLEQLREDFVRKDARTLTSGGFQEIRKFYRAELAIDLASDGYRISEIEEIHTRRHLHIHRGGRADEEYVHKHGGVTTETVLHVSADYLARTAEIFLLVANHIHKECTRRFTPSLDSYLQHATPVVSAGSIYHLTEVEFATDEAMQSFLDPGRVLRADHDHEATITVSNVVVGGTFDGRNARLIVAGDKVQLRAFYRDLHFAKTRGDLTLHAQERLTVNR